MKKMNKQKSQTNRYGVDRIFDLWSSVYKSLQRGIWRQTGVRVYSPSSL